MDPFSSSTPKKRKRSVLFSDVSNRGDMRSRGGEGNFPDPTETSDVQVVQQLEILTEKDKGTARASDTLIPQDVALVQNPEVPTNSKKQKTTTLDPKQPQPGSTEEKARGLLAYYNTKTIDELRDIFILYKEEESAMWPGVKNPPESTDRRIKKKCLLTAYRGKLNPAPKVERYYYLPGQRMVFVFDDGYERIVEDKGRDDKYLKSIGWKPITEKMSLEAKKRAERENSDPTFLHIHNTMMQKYLKRRIESSEDKDKVAGP